MRNILIVDDEKSIRLTLSEFLKEEGYTVYAAGDEKAAYDILDAKKIDVMIMDIVLPDMDGIAFFEKITTEFPSIVGITITGQPTIENAARAVRAGVFDYLCKPVDRITILQAARKAFLVKELAEERRKLEIKNERYRKQLENIIDEQTEEIRKLYHAVEQSPASVIITDTNGDIEYVNPSFTEITGYHFDEVLGENPRILKSGQHTNDFYKMLWERLTAKKTWQGEFLNRRKDGKRYWEFAVISPVLNKNDEIVNYIAIKNDISYEKEMEKKVLNVREMEQRRIGQDLHDGIGQELTGLAFMTKTLANRLEKQDLPEKEDARRLLHQLNTAIGHVRSISYNLYPSRLENAGLEEALRDLIDNFREYYEVTCILDIRGSLSNIEYEKNIHIYRIIQEAVNNAIRHGKAGRIEVSITRLHDELHLSVKDDGVGISSLSNARKGLGIYGMASRASFLNATFDIRSSPNAGTDVSCLMKLEEENT